MNTLRRAGGLLGVGHAVRQRRQDAQQRGAGGEAGLGLVGEQKPPVQQAEQHHQRRGQPPTGEHAGGGVLLANVLERLDRHVGHFHHLDAVVGQRLQLRRVLPPFQLRQLEPQLVRLCLQLPHLLAARCQGNQCVLRIVAEPSQQGKVGMDRLGRTAGQCQGVVPRHGSGVPGEQGLRFIVFVGVRFHPRN